MFAADFFLPLPYNANEMLVEDILFLSSHWFGNDFISKSETFIFLSQN